MRADNQKPLEVSPSLPPTSGGKKKGKKKEPRKVVEITYILDSSSSMGERGRSVYSGPTKYEGAVIGLNEELDALSKDTNVDYIFNLVEFSSYNEVVTRFENATIEGAKAGMKTLSHMRGSTALNDTLFTTITKVLAKKSLAPERQYLVNVLTDGDEYMSRYYNTSQAASKIKEAKDAGITVTFIGTPEDTERAIQNYSVERTNTTTYDGSAQGILKMSSVRTQATMSYSKSFAGGSSAEELSRGFFSKS